MALHSLPGSQYIFYLNFVGSIVTGKIWNNEYGIPSFTTAPFNIDGNPAISEVEASLVTSIWQRVKEDYSPWQIDVTTERPLQFTENVLEVLITLNTDLNGILLNYTINLKTLY
jgi:hypothetical protein